MTYSSSSTSSLAKQLSKIQQANRTYGAGRLNAVHRPSFIFDEREAADLDNDAIFEIGKVGFNELVQVDPGFSRYEVVFFSSKALATDRSILTAEENAGLDKNIRSFLRLLGPHFGNTSSHKVLEWMVRRFRINELNVEEIINCILPYHDTTEFVRMVQILYFCENDRWGFLMEHVKKQAKSISRAFIVSRCLVDRKVLDTIYETALWHGERHQEATVKASMYYSFWAMLAVEYVGRILTVDVTHVSHLLSTVFGCMRVGKKSAELQLVGFMISSQLAGRTSFTQQAIQEVVEFAIKTCHPDNTAELLSFLAELVESGSLDQITESAFNLIVKLPNLVQGLSSLSSRFEISCFQKQLEDLLSQGAYKHDLQCQTILTEYNSTR